MAMKKFRPSFAACLTTFSFLAVLLVVAALSPNVVAQTVTGIVSDGDENIVLPGATIILTVADGTASSGTVTDLEGRYSITAPSAGAYTIAARFSGFQEVVFDVDVPSSGSVNIDFTLSQAGFELNTVVVSASRRAEKVLDAPASVSVISGEDVGNHVGTSSVEALKNTAGIDMAQTGVDRREMVIRGFNNAFSGASYVVTDYRHSAVPSLAVNIYSIMPGFNVDVDHIEVVRGPGSALYGPGVDQGVVHFITKDPFRHPGTTLSISGGEQSYLGVQFRQAGTFGAQNNFGYKVTANYAQAEEWTLDPTTEDSLQIAADGGPRESDYDKINLNGTLEYRFGSNGSLIANGGYATLTSAILSGIGTLQAKDFGYQYAQLRLRMGNFFAQTYVNKNDAGESYVYGVDLDNDGQNDIVVDNGVAYNAQAQYNLTTWGGRQSFIFGADMELTRPDTEGTILDDADGNADIDEYGAYVQSTTELNRKFSLTLAGRLDYNNITDDVTISPRAAIVFKPAIGHSLRLTYNRAFNSPTTNSYFLNIVAAQLPGEITVRGRGSANGFTFDRNPAFELIAGTDLVAHSLNPAALGVPGPIGLPLGATYDAVYAGLAAIPIPALTALLVDAGFPVNEAVTAQLVALLSPELTQVTGFSRGELASFNLSTFKFEPVEDAVDVRPLVSSVTSTIEAGYKGVVNNKFLFAVDVYYSERKDFVGPLLAESPFVFVPTLAGDLTAAVTDGIEGNALLAGALAQLGTSPAAVAGTLVALASGSLPDASTPIAIAQPQQNNPGVGMTPELLLSYRNFGSVEFYGVDVAFEYIGSSGLKIFGNVSVVSDDFFDDSELGEDGTGLSLALNAPALKFRLGAAYQMKNGFSVNAAGRYSDAFPVSSGPYQGDVPEFFLLDIGAGYDFEKYAPGVRADISFSNILDNVHREFVGAPQLGRMVILKLTYRRR